MELLTKPIENTVYRWFSRRMRQISELKSERSTCRAGLVVDAVSPLKFDDGACFFKANSDGIKASENLSRQKKNKQTEKILVYCC